MFPTNAPELALDVARRRNREDIAFAASYDLVHRLRRGRRRRRND